MKTIPEHYEGRGDQKSYTFDLMMREGNTALYRKTNLGVHEWEVMLVRTRTADRHIGGKLAFRKGEEFLPSSREFGQYGWHFNSSGEALAKFTEVRDR